ncbi:MAG: hypothetical protein ACI8UO_005743, partial [Verrucomicrobiales bacterium]
DGGWKPPLPRANDGGDRPPKGRLLKFAGDEAREPG